VVCAPPYYPTWKLEPGYTWPPYRCETLQGVQVWRAPIWVPSRQTGLRRVVHLLSFAASSLPLMLAQLAWRPDVVMTVAPAFVCAPMGLLTGWLCGARTWLHLQDFEIDVAFQLGLLKGRLTRRVVEAAERWLLQRFDNTSSISHRMLARLNAKGVAADRVRFLPNWIDVDAVRPLAHASAYRAELGLAPNAVVALFSGTLGAKQSVLLIPQAARLLAHRPEIVFVICGDGVMKQAVQEACAELTNVRLLPLQPSDRLPELLGLADIHLLTQSPEAEDLVLPSKLTGMLASGRAVVATTRAGTEIAEVLRDCGVRVQPDDAAGLAAAIEELATQPERRAAMGSAARYVAETRMSAAAVLAALAADLCDTAGLLEQREAV
jgi:colanic acid biosynthesis glycosyl transferase WcaI